MSSSVNVSANTNVNVNRVAVDGFVEQLPGYDPTHDLRDDCPRAMLGRKRMYKRVRGRGSSGELGPRRSWERRSTRSPGARNGADPEIVVHDSRSGGVIYGL